MTLKHHRITILALALVVAALFATSASARPISNLGPYADTSQPPTQVTTSAQQAPVVQVEPSSGFDWGDAGIGAGAAFAIVAMAGGSLLLVSNRRARRAAVAG